MTGFSEPDTSVASHGLLRPVGRGAVIWLLMLAIAIAGAGFGEGYLSPRLGPAGGHVVGTLVVVALFLGVIAQSVRWIIPDLAPRHLWLLGAGWTAATVLFEFAFGHFVMGHPWSRLLHDYNLFAGRIWLLVLLAILFGPPWLGRAQGFSERSVGNGMGLDEG